MSASPELLPSLAESPPDVTPRKRYRTYSDQEKARAMALYDMCGGNLTEASRKSGIPDSTLSQWIRSQAHANNKNLPKLRNEAGLSLADDFEEIAVEVASVALRKLRSKGADKIPFGQLMAGGGVAVANSQLLRGLATSINLDIERTELVVIMQSSLSAGLEMGAIDVTPADSVKHISEGEPASGDT